MARLVWTEEGGCSSCKHCAMDMEMDPYCVHPTVKIYHRYGVNISKAIRDFCGEGGDSDKLKLHEPRQVVVVAAKGEGQDGK